MKEQISIFWFRRDLRLHDNHGLYHALNSGYPVLPIFIFDEDILHKLPEQDARLDFIHHTISEINSVLKNDFKSGLLVKYGQVRDVFDQLINEYEVKAVYTNHDYEPYAKTRDEEAANLLANSGIEFHTYKDQVIFERNEVVKKDGNPYVVYTPYMRRWFEKFSVEGLRSFPSEKNLFNLLKYSSVDIISLNDMGFKRSNQNVRDYTVNNILIKNYEATRNFPAQDATSRLGPHLRFGTVSVRDMVRKADKEHNKTFLKELVWREFFMQILWHFPQTVNKSFKPKYDRIEWRNDPEEFKAWCEGRTGYPLVDAGMRQLNETGFMHNRVRMLTGSFLCKHLLIDWRWGEAYFAEKLHDYEMASNVGNWQWVAGSGVDASPYFRIFNPTTQIQKFDKGMEYIKTWVPDYQELTYPQPIVDHKFARERCLETYKSALN
ncbi:MAG: deoxyribodipyrimidine photo-lyase [Flavobacteriaceae bacterium]|nr:deoxyribodipyrimidine photo-lyase [Flavobacteriaceae bacterium]